MCVDFHSPPPFPFLLSCSYPLFTDLRLSFLVCCCALFPLWRRHTPAFMWLILSIMHPLDGFSCPCKVRGACPLLLATHSPLHSNQVQAGSNKHPPQPSFNLSVRIVVCVIRCEQGLPLLLWHAYKPYFHHEETHRETEGRKQQPAGVYLSWASPLPLSQHKSKGLLCLF